MINLSIIDRRSLKPKRKACVYLPTNIMELAIINIDNPVLEFYSKLLYFITTTEYFEYDPDFAEDLINIQKNNLDKISVDIDVNTLKGYWVEADNETDEDMQNREYLTSKCFSDLSGQMRTEGAKEIFGLWVSNTGIYDDLHVHIRKEKDLGDSHAAITIVVSDSVLFKKYLCNPNSLRGEIQITEA